MDKSMAFITLTPENVMSEHLCCAIADKKHQTGVNDKRNWLAERIKDDTSSANWMRRERCSSSMPRWKKPGFP